jgi:hypothetical protein
MVSVRTCVMVDVARAQEVVGVGVGAELDEAVAVARKHGHAELRREKPGLPPIPHGWRYVGIDGVGHGVASHDLQNDTALALLPSRARRQLSALHDASTWSARI